ncbi:alpha/beta fold hydrolase [Labrys wisconsinensis]|uniref:Pimeloyl-ACP methyl ester carboxylesterase n=1 Tax=Labrys wisconsinensis TaxID=425677 RepID=A0ABU0JIF3_9HYPH|nr:alpha/beta hydrolase [Labrys wisconsinensis]MDQ0474053.1 pimeloyl-ACP methyl ester carboxylesterase [Labrys wisconsinensis]
MSIAPARIVGAGPRRLLAIHGWMGDHRLFEPFLAALDPTRFTCALLDCRGYGRRRGEAGEWTVAAIAHDALALADGLGWDRFHGLGHSMGGMAVQRLMVDSPDRLQSAVLVAAVPASGARLGPERRALLLEAIETPAARRRLIDINTGGGCDDAFLDRLVRLSLSASRPDALKAYMDSWTGTDFAEEARGSRVPVLAVVGARDPGAASAQALPPLYPALTLRVMAGSGHYPMQEEPAVLATLVAGHILACDGFPAA